MRVVQWGTGNTGSVALQEFLESPNLDLFGKVCHDNSCNADSEND